MTLSGFIVLVVPLLLSIVGGTICIIGSIKHTKLIRIKTKKAYEAAKKSSLNDVADAKYIKEVNTLYKAKRLSGEKLHHRGEYRTEALFGDNRLNAGRIKRILHYIGDLEVFLPDGVSLHVGTEYEIVGLSVRGHIFVSQINNEDCIRDKSS